MNISLPIIIKESIRTAEIFLQRGEYQKALEIIEYFWEINNELDNERFAEVFLITGKVIGFCQSSERFPNPQEMSKDFLFKARRLFKKFNNQEKLAGCENGLANAYQRAGDISEARIWIRQALNRPLNDNHPERLYSFIVEAILDSDECLFEDSRIKLEKRKLLFESCDDSFLIGNYYSLAGLVYKNTTNYAESIICLEKARDHFQELGHQIYLSKTLNNLAQLYRAEKRFAEAFAAASRSRKIFKRLGNLMYEAFAADTQAGILLEMQRFRQADKFISFAVSNLENFENKHFLFESLQTRIRILIGLGKLNEALHICVRISNLASTIFGENKTRDISSLTAEAIKKYIHSPAELEKLKRKEFWTSLEMSEYIGIRLNNDDFKSIGLRCGMLAIAVEKTISDGDLAAVLDLASKEVYLGYLTNFCGLTALEIPNQPPVVFEFRKIKILGKVVGKVRDPLGDFPVIEII